jgi:Taurine catabolism dioxygenase TauD, TfdA family
MRLQLFRACAGTTNRMYSTLAEVALPKRFLRDSHEINFDPATKQRIDIQFDRDNGKPISNQFLNNRYSIKSSKRKGSHFVVDWADGVTTNYSSTWIEQNLRRWKKPVMTRKLWTGLKEVDVRNSDTMSIQFERLIYDEDGMSRALRTIYDYGILLVKETPIDDGGAAIAAMASAVSGSSKKNQISASLIETYRNGGREIVLSNGTDGPLRTLYGTVWFTTSDVQPEGTSVADSAYGQGSLPLHTDMTYLQSPPGLQIFTMIQPAASGGESVYADGLAVCDILRNEDPRAFQILSSTPRRYHCIDHETGWHLEASGKLINACSGEVIGIRHNDLDRLPDLPSYLENDSLHYELFYEELAHAHAKWDSILSRDSIRLVIKLRPGDTIILENQVSIMTE